MLPGSDWYWQKMNKMSIKKAFLLFAFAGVLNTGYSQTLVKMDLPQQADQVLHVVALFDEELPEGIPVVLGLMGYDVEGGITPYAFEWLLNDEVISTSDIAVFTPKQGDDLVLSVSDNNHCRASTAFNLKALIIPKNPDEAERNISIFPTVFNGEIFIEFPESAHKKALVRIFTLSGTMVFQEYLTESTSLHLNLTPGSYFISVKTGEQHKFEKIIAQ
jgi:hypothetical protein